MFLLVVGKLFQLFAPLCPAAAINQCYDYFSNHIIIKVLYLSEKGMPQNWTFVKFGRAILLSIDIDSGLMKMTSKNSQIQIFCHEFKNRSQ